METKGSQESLQSHLSFFHHGRLFSSDRDDSSDSDDYLETGRKVATDIIDIIDIYDTLNEESELC